MGQEEEIKIDLELVDSKDLIRELANRHDELIVIRNDQKTPDQDRIFVKTGFGHKGKPEKGFDLINALEMLNATMWQLTYEYLESVGT